jgi:hypothetical protein
MCSTASVTGTDSRTNLLSCRPVIALGLQTTDEDYAVKKSYVMAAQAARSSTMAANYNSPLLAIAIQLSAIIQASIVHRGTEEHISVE